ncbi:MAG: hypothetical protein HC869_05355 [Rhodospirillales bacterium]|nr:hypothetical protein [Rhodospirillales bacterium]
MTLFQQIHFPGPTPAIILAQNPEREAPSPVVEATLGGMERARREGLPPGSYQVAELALPGGGTIPDVPPVGTASGKF